MPIPEPNNNYSSAFNIGQLTAAKSYRDVVGGTDLADFYKFAITQNSTVTLNLSGLTDDAEIAIAVDLNKDGQFSTNEIIDNTALSGSVDRTLIADLGTGTYYALVSPGSSFFPDGNANTRYTLRFSPKVIAGVSPTKDPGFTYATAFNIGPLTVAKTYKQFVGGTDLGDLYRFNLDKNSTVTLSLTGMSEDAEIAIVSDLNRDGQFTTNEILDNTALSGSVDRTLISDLGTGTYYALVSPSSSFFPDGRENTNYTLRLAPKAIAGVSPTKDPGFTYATAFKAGPLTTAQTYKQFVGGTDLGDFYQFRLDRNSTVTATVSGLREDAEIAIVSDLNGDGQFTTNEIIGNTSFSGSVDRTLISDLGTGTYYALVSPSSSFFPDGRENTNYTLRLAPKAIAGVIPKQDPGFTYRTAFKVGQLTTAKTYKQFVGATDLGDFYQFSLSRNRTVTLSLTGLREDAEIAIVSDQNGDGLFSTSEIIDNTASSGSVDRALASDLGKGTYYVLVSPSSSFFPDGRENTNYTLRMSAGATRSGTSQTAPKQQPASNGRTQPRENGPERPVAPKRSGSNPLLPQAPQLVMQSVELLPRTQSQPIADASVLQALSPTCDALTIGAALLALGKHCVLR